MEYISTNKIELIFSNNYIYIMLALILSSAFFSISETVISSIKMTKLESMKKEKIKGSKLAFKITENYDKTLTTVLVGNNIVNIALATISTKFFYELLKESSFSNYVDWISVAVMTLVILIFGEIIPKTYGKINNEKLCLILAPILNVLSFVMYPLTIPFIGLKNTLVKRPDIDDITVSESEFDTIIDTMSDEGVIDGEEKEMIQSVLTLNDISVLEIMTPRVDILALDVDTPIDDIKKFLFEKKYSRIPVFKDSIDNIIGLLYERDFFTKIIINETIDIYKLIKEPLIVPSTMKVDTLIEDLQRRKQHMAVVIDEFGGTSGIVTMEDALEELVGEIYDEYDIEEKTMILKLKDNKYHINASVSVDDFFEELKLVHKPKTDSKSIAGFVLELFDNLPEEDDKVNYITDSYKLTFKVEKIMDRRIRSLSLVINKFNNI